MKVIVKAIDYNNDCAKPITLTGRWQIRDWEGIQHLYLEKSYTRINTVMKEVPGYLWGTRMVKEYEEKEATGFVHESDIQITIEYDIQECSK